MSIYINFQNNYMQIALAINGKKYIKNEYWDW